MWSSAARSAPRPEGPPLTRSPVPFAGVEALRRDRPLWSGAVPAVAALLVLVVGLAGCGADGDGGDGAAGTGATPPGSSAAPVQPGSSPPGDDTGAAPPPAASTLGTTVEEVGPEPVAVAIPTIGVSSGLLHLGLRPDGTAEVPEDFDLASWYDLGGRPGGSGLPTAILGHVDSTSGPAVFFHLRDLVPGDEIEITLSDDSVAVYAVTGTEQHPKDRFPTAAVFGATRDDVLRLVTCSGGFDRGARSYTDNLVVSAERIA